MNIVENIVDTIAYKGPIIITIITALQLINQIPYMVSFAIFNYINIKLNEFLKICFRELRPEKINLAEEHQKYRIFTMFKNNKPSSAHVYGMPSGHAQSGAYALGFLWFVQKTSPAFMLASFIFVLTLLQRWIVKRHTIMQLFVGFLIGFGFSGLVYYGTKNFLYSKIKFNDISDFIFKYNYSYSPVHSIPNLN